MTYRSNISEDDFWKDFEDFEFGVPPLRFEEEEKPRKLTDEEYLKIMRKKMVAYVSKRASGNGGFDLQDLMAIVNHVIHEYQEEFYGLEIEEYKYKERYDEEMKLRERLRPAINEIIEEVSFIGQKKRSIFILNRSLAEAAINRLLEDAGYDFYIHYNLHHAKVHIKLTRQKKAVLYLEYDRLEKQLPKVLETLETLKTVYDNFGAGSGVISLYNGDDDNFAEAREERSGI